MAYALRAFAIECPDPQHPLLELLGTDVAYALPLPLPIAFIQGYLEKPAPLAFRGTLRGVVY